MWWWVGTTAVFAAGTGIVGGVSSPTSLGLAADHEVCDEAGDPLCFGVSVVSVILDDRINKFVCEGQ